MRIAVIIEGKTEKAFLSFLRDFIRPCLPSGLPKIDSRPYDGRIPKEDKLKEDVQRLLQGKNASDHVIALTDVYTGTNQRDFNDAQDAKEKMRKWVGDETRFHPHAAQYDFEAWLLPYWTTIQRLARHNKAAPSGNPENVNHNNPPSRRINEIFEIGKCRKSYVKARDAKRILRENDLGVAVNQCIELKSLVNTILKICGGETIK